MHSYIGSHGFRYQLSCHQILLAYPVGRAFSIPNQLLKLTQWLFSELNLMEHLVLLLLFRSIRRHSHLAGFDSAETWIGSTLVLPSVSFHHRGLPALLSSSVGRSCLRSNRQLLEVDCQLGVCLYQADVPVAADSPAPAI